MLSDAQWENAKLPTGEEIERAIRHLGPDIDAGGSMWRIYHDARLGLEELLRLRAEVTKFKTLASDTYLNAGDELRRLRAENAELREINQLKSAQAADLRRTLGERHGSHHAIHAAKLSLEEDRKRIEELMEKNRRLAKAAEGCDE